MISVAVGLGMAASTMLLGVGAATAVQQDRHTLQPAADSVAVVHGDEDQVSFDELRQLVIQFQATGEIRGQLLLYLVDQSEFYHDLGYDGRAIMNLESFKRYAPRFVSTPTALATLITAADDVIAQIRATMEPAAQ